MSSSLFPAFDASASTVTVNYRDTGYFVTVDAPDAVNLSVDATPTGQTVVSSASTVNVVTNAPLGYKLYLTTENNELTASGISQTFSPTTAGTSISLNSWGFSLDPTATTGNVWNPVPVLSSSSSKPQYEASAAVISSSNTSNYPTGTNVNVYYGINSDTSMPSGTYSTTVTYTAFAEGIPPSVTNMQDFTYADCQNLTLEQTYYLTDSRDTKQYKIARLKDGNCWMQENLELDGGRTLTSADSNVANDVILPANSAVVGSHPIHEMAIRPAYSGYKGNFYNWCAAVAITDCSDVATEPNTSVCPKGWILPGSSGSHSYNNLLSKYGLPTSNTTYINYSSTLESTPLLYTYAGVWTTEYGFQGQAISLITKTPSSSVVTIANSFWYQNYGNLQLNYEYPGGKDASYPIRCVLESRSLQDITYMQDMTSGICANTPEGTTKRLLDKRGYGNAGSDTTTTYGVIKAKDGNCWMTDNLNLYNKTLDAADSDFASGTFTLPASSNWGNSATAVSSALIHVNSNQSYYNWCSSIAIADCSSITTQQNNSICPKNWQLPIYGGSNTNKTYAKLFYDTNITSVDDLLNNTYNLGFTGIWGWWHYTQGRMNEGQSHFWTSTPQSASSAWNMQYDNSTITAEYAHSTGFGWMVRCVSR